MKLECSRKDLSDAIDFVANVAAVRSPNALFQSVRLEASGSNLRILACDGEMWAERTILAAVDSDGECCIQCRVLKELVTSLPDGPVTIDAKSGSAVVRSGASDWRLMAFPADDFPGIPEIAANSNLAIKFSEFTDAVNGVSYAVASDTSRQVLTGILVTYDGSTLTLVATDTHRLAVLKLPKEGIGASDLKAIVPEKAFRAIKGLPLGADETVTIQFDAHRLMVDAGNARIVSQLLDGAYPQWERVVPDQFTRTWTMDRGELIDNLKRVQILARDSSNRVCFGGDGDHVMISARSEDKGEANEEVAAINSNGEIQIAFNGRYVLDAIQAFQCDAVVAQMTEPSRAAIFKPTQDELGERFCVIMPMALN